MVKASNTTLELPSSTKQRIEEFSNSNYFSRLTQQSLFYFINFLEYFIKLKCPSMIVKHTYIVLFTCFIILDLLKTSKENLMSQCKILLAQTFNAHSTGECMLVNSSIVASTNLLLNQTAKILHSNIENFEKNRKFIICAQFLSIFRKLSFKICLKSLLKIIGNNFFSSIFSLFTNSNSPYLPEKSGPRLSIVIGLEGTLGYFDGVKFIPRPYAKGMLKVLSRYYELVLFTSATEEFANYCMSIVDDENLIVFRLYKQHLNLKPYKDISALGRDLLNVIIVDQQSASFGPFIFNGISVKNWKGEPGDEELLSLTQLLSNACHLDSSVKIAALSLSHKA